ncbi:Bardet-Biedl syndrome 7 protein homolog [Chelonus insularis]|uniref:Bardet-Biedl syndrome 7 protein homolog n=1 Tax=Chelonus insularis TaxID=460826 RepID=UPI00158C38E3|nr:Bardet-Biedl syndrome 7 protein homolog [Chelonus insularis]
MTLVLNRVDYTTVGVTSRGTMKILPSSDPKATQKFAVGDNDGIIYIFSMKKNELQLVFKSLPSYKIEKIVLGGGTSNSNDVPKDRIFVAYNNSVKGYTKKGKPFLEFDTNLMDTISAMFVLGGDLAVCARDVYHRYQNCKDADSLLVGETLNDVILLPSGDSAGSVTAILACGDRAIRILTSRKSPTVLRLSSIPTVFSSFKEHDRELYDRVLLGTQDGKVGLLLLPGSKTVRNIWLLNTYGSEITCLDTYDLDGSGVDIIVGRLDGSVEVFNFSGLDEILTPLLRFKYVAGESITSVGGGVIGTPEYKEVLVTTYSGKIFGLTTKPPGALEAGVASNEPETIRRLEAEIRELEQKYQEQSEYGGFLMSADPFLSPSILCVNHRMTLNRDTATYLLSIELDSPIDFILIQSNTPVELIDDNNNAVLSFSEVNPAKDGNYVLATYRCQVNTNQLETKIKTIEGHSGLLQIYVTCQIQPKCCRVVKIPILALSLHIRVHEDDEEDMKKYFSSSGPYNELKLVGNFTVAEIHAWLSLALPELSERPTLNDNEVKLNYVSTRIGSTLRCQYKKGTAVFSSENVSTILILRDLMTKEATKRKIKLDVFCTVDDGAMKKMLEKIFPQLKNAHELQENVQIINALHDWDMIDNPEETLGTHFQKLLKDEEDLKRKYDKNPKALQEIQTIITELYVDWKRAKGSHQRLTSEMAKEDLNNAMESGEFSVLLELFMKNDSNSPDRSPPSSPTKPTSQDDATES